MTALKAYTVSLQEYTGTEEGATGTLFQRKGCELYLNFIKAQLIYLFLSFDHWITFSKKRIESLV